MKNKATLIVLIAGVMTLAGCKEKKKTDDIIVDKIEVAKPKAPIKQQPSAQAQQVQWMGKSYRVELTRTPDESLPMVQDETGQQYIDNSVLLRVVRQDGTVFFERTFTKGSFDSYLDANYRQTGILSGFVFDEADGAELEFAVCVSHPQSDDEYIPMELTLNSQGGISIKRDADLDNYHGNADDGDDH